MTSIDATFAGAGMFALSALLSVAFPSRATAAIGALAGAVVAGCGLAVAFGSAAPAERVVFAPDPIGALRFSLDAISAMFLVPIGVVGGAAGVYATRYWADDEQPRTHRIVRVGFGIMAAAMTVVVVAHSGVAFLGAWEVMALAAFALIATDHERAEVREAAFVYLVATHACTLGLWAVFAWIQALTGTFGFAPLPAGVGSTGVMLLGLVAFGIKAGFMPLHVWLPSAHATAPTHVSAFLSGVMLKLGIYGIIRVAMLAPDAPPGLGYLVLLLGVISAIGGVVFALAQHDLKRLLAYHSVENIGIILMGIGLALLGRSYGHPSWMVLGLGGALLHVWNHALFKSLLFLAGGAVIHATHTRVIDQLGGLAQRMPRTAALFLIGAVAICGLPPLNGFVSELLIYIGLISAAAPEGSPIIALAAPALALVGALAVACFVKVYGVVFLGTPRSEAGRTASPAPAAMIAPMIVIAAGCVVIGTLPWLVAPALDRAVAAFAGTSAGHTPVAELVPLKAVGLCSTGLLLVCVAFVAVRRRRRASEPGTWDCGYAAPTARIQYTASSFADTLVQMFRAVLRPRRESPQLSAVLPAPSRFHEHVDDAVLERAVRPAVRHWAAWLSRLRVVQGGRVQIYVLYIAATVLGLIAWQLPLGEILANLWSS